MDEEKCVDRCAGKLIRTNHRLMGTYVQLMPRMVQRRMEEMESKAAESAKAAEAAASAHVTPPAAEASPASQTPVGFSQPPPVAPLSDQPFTPMTIDDAGPEARGSVLKPVGLSIPVQLDAAMSNSTTASEVKLSAATPLTPVIGTANFSVLNEAGPSYTAGLPPPPIAGARIESEISAPLFTPSKPDVSTVAAPTV